MKWLSPEVATIDGSFHVRLIGTHSLSGKTFIYYAQGIDELIEAIDLKFFKTLIIQKM